MAFIAGRSRWDLAVNITQPPITRFDLIDVQDRESQGFYQLTCSINSSAANARGLLFALKVYNGSSRGLRQRTSPAPDQWDNAIEYNEGVSTPTGYTSVDAIMNGAGSKKAKFDAVVDWCAANGLFGGLAGTRA